MFPSYTNTRKPKICDRNFAENPDLVAGRGRLVAIFRGNQHIEVGGVFVGRQELLSGYQTIHLWDVSSGKELRQFSGEPGLVDFIAFLQLVGRDAKQKWHYG